MTHPKILVMACAYAVWGIPHAAYAQVDVVIPRMVSSSPIEPVASSEYANRRKALAANVEDGIIVALGSVVPEEASLVFWQNPNFYYLTGFQEPNATLVMVKRRGRLVNTTLFVDPRDPIGESWDGARLGPQGVTRALGIQGRTNADFFTVFDSLMQSDPDHVYVIGNVDPMRTTMLSRDDQVIRSISAKFANTSFVSANRFVTDLRKRKSPAELVLLQRAIEISVAAQQSALRTIAPGRAEYEVQASLEYTFRKSGAERPAFASIVGSGPNSTILHYNANRRVMRDGDLVVVDIGASYQGYAGDVTRTAPVNGRFSQEQRLIYQAVRRAQAEAEKVAVIGARVDAMARTAIRVIGEELTRLGLIESPSATYACRVGGKSAGIAQCPQYSLYYMHGLGHAIGLEVHDVGAPGVHDGILTAGDAFTIEPGIYVRAHTLDLIEDLPENRTFREKVRSAVGKFKNIGVRIEDAYLVTDRGVQWISRAPREIDEIEAAMRAGKARKVEVRKAEARTAKPRTAPQSAAQRK